MKILFAYVIFLISLSILVGLSILYTQRFRELTRYTDQVEQTHMVILELNKLMSFLKDAETGTRGFLLSGDSSFLEPYQLALDSIKPTYQNILKIIPPGTEQYRRLESLNILFYERLDIMRHSTLLYSATTREDFVNSLQRGKQKMSECRAVVQDMNEDAYHYLQRSRRTKAFYQGVTPGFFLIIMGFTAIAFVISFYVILREYRGRLKNQKDLEQKIIALNQSYRELEQIAHVSSHDLQEPLRKISVFCDRLSMKYTQTLDEEGKSIISRIQHAAVRTRELVEILSNYTGLITGDTQKQTVQLSSIFNSLEDKYQIATKYGTLELEKDLSIVAHPGQVLLLFDCLIDNSIKFKHKNRPLAISISKGIVDQDEIEDFQLATGYNLYTKIIYRDNGVGFDNEFSEKIFSIFQRLHTEEIEGKGVGLAIVRRVMINHDGIVRAKGRVQEGAEFTLYFPATTE
jgi:CHASE3 domain sensor protein/nitrogen-specific signal transduction histidine kinase